MFLKLSRRQQKYDNGKITCLRSALVFRHPWTYSTNYPEKVPSSTSLRSNSVLNGTKGLGASIKYPQLCLILIDSQKLPTILQVSEKIPWHAMTWGYLLIYQDELYNNSPSNLPGGFQIPRSFYLRKPSPRDLSWYDSAWKFPAFSSKSNRTGRFWPSGSHAALKHETQIEHRFISYSYSYSCSYHIISYHIIIISYHNHNHIIVISYYASYNGWHGITFWCEKGGATCKLEVCQNSRWPSRQSNEQIKDPNTFGMSRCTCLRDCKTTLPMISRKKGNPHKDIRFAPTCTNKDQVPTPQDNTSMLFDMIQEVSWNRSSHKTEQRHSNGVPSLLWRFSHLPAGLVGSGAFKMCTFQAGTCNNKNLSKPMQTEWFPTNNMFYFNKNTTWWWMDNISPI